MISKTLNFEGSHIEYNQYADSLTRNVIVLVGGYGDDKDTFNPLVTALKKELPNSDTLVTFSFSSKEGCVPTFTNQINDLRLFLKHLLKETAVETFTIICTSDGAVSSTYALFDPDLKDKINKVIYLDPAIYYTSSLDQEPDFIWHGFVEYAPEEEVIGDLFGEYEFDATLDVVHLIIKNYNPTGYAEDLRDRGEDNPKMHTRLSTNMVESFYMSIPDKTKGKYIELNGVPHAFMRDGDVESNIEELVKLLIKLFS